MTPTDKYLRWLRGLVDSEGPGPHYNTLFDMAWAIEYRDYIPNDDNRASDGLRLREEFELETSLKLPDYGRCRMLEFLIALALRLNEAVYDYRYPDQVSDWFWLLVRNLGLIKYNDRYSDHPILEIEEIFSRLNNREYGADGTGGLFPLDNPQKDQRDVEIWYQMMAYLAERT